MSGWHTSRGEVMGAGVTNQLSKRAPRSRRLLGGLTAAAAIAVCLNAATITRVQAVDDALQGSEILSRPTDRGVTIHAIAARALTATVEWSRGSDDWRSTAAVSAGAGEPFDVVVTGLAPNTEYVYRLTLQVRGEAGPPVTGPARAFRTQRTAGEPFTFVVQADPHLDENSSPDVYAQALRNQLADRPDFLVDLGDAAMSDRCVINESVLCDRSRAVSYEQVAARNALMRSYFAAIGHSVPLFMVLGNHEAEAGWASTGATATLAAWSLRARTFFYANPVKDGFYTGNDASGASDGPRQNYFAFEWGDALFVMLDPFGYTMRKPTQFTDADMWSWTLGDRQYRWLADTLSASRARFKFVFSHHMTGGGAAEVRGAAAFAKYFEWGGQNLDGSWGFTARRPGWEKPIHQLFVDTGVTIWFHGHDHLYAREVVDGVIYQSVPQPSTARYQGPDLAREYGYLATPGETAFVTPGHLRVSVNRDTVGVAFLRAVAPGQQTAALQNRAVVTEYTLR